MPVSYQFSQDEKKITLNEVDEYICNYIGVPVNDDRYVMEFSLITDALVGALVAEGGSDIRCSHMIYLWNKIIERSGCDESASDIALLFDVVETYDFRAWR